MAEIDIEEVRKQASKKKDEQQTIKAETIEGKTYFYSKYLDKHFSDYGEANAAETDARKIDAYKKEGKNELGQTPEEVKKYKKIAELLEKKKQYLDEASKIDVEIQRVKRTEISDVKEDFKKKK